MLKYVSAQNIDLEKWQKLVHQASDASIFCNHWYLSQLCSWDAIILGDYLGAIALPTRTHFGIKQLYQPPFLQHCSWFGTECNANELSSLLKRSFQDIRINSYTALGLQNRKRRNIELPLNASAQMIHAAFKKDLKKNLRKTEGVLHIQTTDDPSTSIELYKEAYGELNELTTDNYRSFRALFGTAYDKGHSICYSAYHDDEVVASLCFMKFNDRLHYVLGAPNKKGKELNALSHVFWHIIKQYENSPMVIDFEGSTIESVARFYNSFGSTETFFGEYSYSKGLVKVLRSVFK